MKLYSRMLVTWSLHVESNLMTRIVTIISLLFATTARGEIQIANE